MSKRRCDPVDCEAVLRTLAEAGCGLIGSSRDAGMLRRLYVAYASVAAKPYARASWEKMLRQSQRGGAGSFDGTGGSLNHTQNTGIDFHASMSMTGEGEPPEFTPAKAEAERRAAEQRAAEYWARFEQVKPANVLTTTSDNAAIKVRGGALIVADAPLILTYEKRGTKPLAIVMLGWSGYVSIEAMRFCNDHARARQLNDRCGAWSATVVSVCLNIDVEQRN